MPTPPTSQTLLPSYDESFLEHHAGSIITDPSTALVELVANSWDAGADEVVVTWPDEPGQEVSVEDNGTGMTRAEFERRWLKLNYNREKEQGSEVAFPKGVRKRRRIAFGRNGIGRHAMFLFGNEYTVETRKDGSLTVARLRRSSGATPFDVEFKAEKKADGHGTKLSARALIVPMSADGVAELIGSHFVSDPDFAITVNGRVVTLTDLDHLCEKMTLDIEGFGQVRISRFDSERTGKSSKPHGVAWWVKRRLVGTAGWHGLIDERTSPAKRYTYVVEADQLAPFVKADWSGFRANEAVTAARQHVGDFILDDLRAAMADVRRERKRAALVESKGTLRQLPPIAQEQVAAFAEQIQEQCPTIGERELNSAVAVLANLEKARTGYTLLDKLAALKPDDLDGLNAILDEWSVKDARKVLGELRYRLSLIEKLEGLVEDKRADELHDLQPLFENGLWIFGPEFEAISFMSNRTLKTVIEQLLDGKVAITNPDDRPDFVVLPDSTVGVYSSDSHDDEGEVSGFWKVVIVELKKGGFEITSHEKDQAMGYARALRKSGKVNRQTRIVAYVLGAAVNAEAEEATKEGETSVIARPYGVVLRQAHARTFNLLKKIESVGKARFLDDDLQTALGSQTEMFGQ